MPVSIDSSAHRRADRARESSTSTRAPRLEARCTSAPRSTSPAASPPPTSCATRGRSTSSAASGPKVWDVDGNEMWDFHNGFGSMVQGHAHPAIGAAIARALRAAARTSRRRPRTRSSSATSSPRRWGLPKWRYTNSGSESTMDAIRIARGYTGRETIVKIFGSYHGHHDARDGLDRRRVRQDRRPREPRLAALRRRHPAGRRRPRRSPCRSTTPSAMERRIERLDRRGPQARLRDHGGGDDEPRGRAPRARLPRGRARASRAATASC